MKKAYSLDFTTPYLDDRLQNVKDILSNLDTDLPASDITQLADYILCGKDREHYVSAVDSHDIIQPSRQFDSYSTKDESLASLDELVEAGASAADHATQLFQPDTVARRSVNKYVAPKIVRTTYDEEGNVLQYGDDWYWDEEKQAYIPIQEMRDLWESIDRIETQIKVREGKMAPPEDFMQKDISDYNLWRMKHSLIVLRRQQYYIKDSYKPQIRLLNAQHATNFKYDFDGDCGYWLSLEEWSKKYRENLDKAQPKLDVPSGRSKHKVKVWSRYYMPVDTLDEARKRVDENGEIQVFWRNGASTLDYENPEHISAILDSYAELLLGSYEKVDSATRELCWDIEEYVDKAQLTDEEQFLLEQKVAHKDTFLVRKYLVEHGFEDKSVVSIKRIQNVTIPNKIADAAKKHRLMNELAKGEIEGLFCSLCGKFKPKNNLFFSKSVDKRSGYCSQCKECQAKNRAKKRAADKEKKQ